MLKARHVFLLLILTGIIGVLGCTPKKATSLSQLAMLFKNNFVGLSLPSMSTVKEEGLASSKMDFPLDRVWESLILVAMQYGPIVEVNEAKRFVVAPPFILYAENEDGVKIYTFFMEELFKSALNSAEISVEVTEEEKNYYLEKLLAQVETQIRADANLQAGGAWTYLLE